MAPLPRSRTVRERIPGEAVGDLLCKLPAGEGGPCHDPERSEHTTEKSETDNGGERREPGEGPTGKSYKFAFNPRGPCNDSERSEHVVKKEREHDGEKRPRVRVRGAAESAR
jgi:hypothetical protein